MKVVMLGNNTKEEIEKRLQVVASAGMLSRAEGTVTQVFENNDDYEKNLKLAKLIIGYGHKSIAEHDYIVFALEDVTPIIEQTIIEYRLTSFTIKSRRNVDFRNVGFYIPNFYDKNNQLLQFNENLKETYKNYMKSLFDKYGDLVDEGLPIEDCRYILPYSYHSNIIMGCDANELLNMTSDLLYGKVSKITEMKELGMKLKELISENAPYLIPSLEKEENKAYYNDNLQFIDYQIYEPYLENNLISKPKLNNYTQNGDEFILCNILMSRYNINYENAKVILEKMMTVNPGIEKRIMKALSQNKHQRELEQITYSFEIPISLAVLTHITRHRMHSLLVPDFVPMWNLENYIIPNSIKENHLQEYQTIYKNNKAMYEYFKNLGVREEDLVYFYLSGNACNIYTTMNARTLKWISRMRCCNKAQWEIRDILNEMVKEAKKVTPLVASSYGAYCTTEGYCPEGKDSCKNRGVVVKQKKLEPRK